MAKGLLILVLLPRPPQHLKTFVVKQKCDSRIRILQGDGRRRLGCERLEKGNDGKALNDVVDERVDEAVARYDAVFFFLKGEEDRKGESMNEPEEAKTVSFPSAVAAATTVEDVAVEDVTVAPDDDVHSVGDVAKLEPT